MDVRADDALFGGLPIVLGGDFAQILPVVQRGNRAAIVDACLQRSFLWPSLTVLHLRRNMRVRDGPENERFAVWVRSLAAAEAAGTVLLLEMITSFRDKQQFYARIYPPELLASAPHDWRIFKGRAILTVRNDTVTAVNRDLIGQLPGDAMDFPSVDTAEVDHSQEAPPVELLQSFEPVSLPPSRLTLKVSALIILIQNLYPKEGLCNSTCLVVTRLRRRCLETRILTGEFAGQLRVIPRIQLTSTEGELPFIITRRQFPVRPCFAMTVNKSQGQSLDVAGVDLRRAVFTHG